VGERALIVLDTHAWIWYATDDGRLSRRARAAIAKTQTLGVHPVSCWEVAMLVEHKRLRIRMPVRAWVDAALERPKVELLAFDASAAVRAAGLGKTFPNDPADRFIVATALELGASLVTSDRRIEEWGEIQVVW
jgi:PIN domain nuclease of toxin-antitoxin system